MEHKDALRSGSPPVSTGRRVAESQKCHKVGEIQSYFIYAVVGKFSVIFGEMESEKKNINYGTSMHKNITETHKNI